MKRKDARRAEAQRRLRLLLDAAIPDDTGDDRPEGSRHDHPEAWTEAESGESDKQLRDDVPPHHG